MKRLTSIMLVACTMGIASEGRAGSIDYLTNQSADYIRTLGRNAATDAADIVSHNPAGTAFLRHDGLYLSLSAQTILKDFSIEYRGKTYGATDPTPILPSFHVVFKWDRLALFGAVTVPAGGGNLTYNDGVPYLIPLVTQVEKTKINDSLVPADCKASPRPKDAVCPMASLPRNGLFEGSSMYLAGTFGAAFKPFKWISISAAGRVISASKSYHGYAYYESKSYLAELDATKKAAGIGGIFGLHVRPFKMFDLGIRFETETALEFETESTTTNLDRIVEKTIDGEKKMVHTFSGTALESFLNGATEQRNLPAVLALGLAFHPLPYLTVNANLNYYFINMADKDDDYDGEGIAAKAFVKGYDDDYDDGVEISFSVEYKITKNLLASVGYNHAFSGSNENTLSDFEYTLDSNAVGFGVRYTLFDRLKLTGGFAGVFYNEAQNHTVNDLAHIFEGHEKAAPETFNKQSFVFALGVEYRLF